MINPVIHDNLTAIFVRHYKMSPKNAAEASLKFMEVLELYKMQIIIGDWVIPDIVELSPFEMMVRTQKETMEREPWLAREIQ